jgi:hypothetical protein
LIDEIFAVLVRDFNGYAVELSDKTSTTDAQARFATMMIRRPAHDLRPLQPGSGRSTSFPSAAPTRCARDAGSR